jgi:hypothetical protein
VRLKGLGKLKKEEEEEEDIIQPATFQPVTVRLNQLRYRVPLAPMNVIRNKNAINKNHTSRLHYGND